ncbi:MAG TPA: hypothetical protein O0X00_05525 [Methanocorpusculum sp.]|nr:hypothetical protein [Methanocorpusculum sp.]
MPAVQDISEEEVKLRYITPAIGVIRNAVSIGEEWDTLAAICGGAAEDSYGIPADICRHSLTFPDGRLIQSLVEFENKYSSVMEIQYGGYSCSGEMGVRFERC